MTIRIGTSERDGTFWSQGQALKAIFERHAALSPGRGARKQVRQHRERRPPRLGRDRIRLHGLELDRAREERRGAVRAPARSRHGGADERRPAVLHRAGGDADPLVRRPARAAHRGRAAHERHGAARPRHLRRARRKPRRRRAGLSRFRLRRAGAGGRRGRRPVPVPDPQQGDDRARRACRAARRRLCARRARDACSRRCRIIGAR